MGNSEQSAAERLAAVVVARRAELGLTMTEVQARGGPSTVTMTGIETAQWLHEPTGSTLRKIDTALAWPAGTSRQVIAGLRDPFDVATEHVRWRVGRKVGRTIYRQLGAEPSDDDQLIGMMDTAELAQEAVDAVNQQRDATPR